MSSPIQTRPSASDEAADSKVPAGDDPLPPSQTLQNDQKAPEVPSVDVKALTDKTLNFLATASNETLGACLAGLGAGTYLVLGRVGLILIGVVGGVVLHATWEGQSSNHGFGDKGPVQEARKRETGVDIARRVLDWRNKAVSGDEKTPGDHDDLDVKLHSGQALDYSEFRPETATALTELTDAVIRDYVKWWYSPILPSEESFPAECRQTLTAFMISVSSHLSRKRPADNFVDFVTRSSSFMIIVFQELSAAIQSSPDAAAAEAIETYLEQKPDSTLGSILDSKYQAKQFDTAADDILQSYLDPKTYNCKPAQIFLRQILAKVVLEMIVVSCSKPEWINEWIIYLLEDGEPELMHAIDAGVEGSSGQLQYAKKNVEREESAADAAASSERRNHKRVVSKAQEAMDEAMREAQRLSQMIAEEEARKLRELETPSNSSLVDDHSESTTAGIVTPTSSQSETLAESAVQDLGITNLPTQSLSQAGPPSPPKVQEEPPQQEVKRSFTSFDQIIPNQPPTALMANPPPPLTLHNCQIVIFDDSAPGEKGTIKTKPTAEYLIQIEPSSHHHSGWMTVRKYADFEALHEVMRRIAAVSGSTGFTEAHSTLPAWKGHTKASLRGELERYLNDGVKYKHLAESDAMKRFLEKESQVGKSPGSRGFGGIAWPGQTFENMGKGVVDGITKAPKEAGKALFGGVTGILGSVTTPLGGTRKKTDSVSSGSGNPTRAATAPASTPSPTPIQNRHGRAESTVSELPTHIRTESVMTSFTRRTSTDSLRAGNSPVIDQQPQREAPMERRPSLNPEGDGKRSGPSSLYGASRSNSRAPSIRNSMDLSPVMGGDQILNLPPMPSNITDDYTSSPKHESHHSHQASRASTASLTIPNTSITDTGAPSLPRRPSATSLASSSKQPAPPTERKPPANHAPLTTQETTVLIELFFALVNELYTLSSAWGIRLTLLSAAKSFLLRPSNPQLLSIQTLLQSTVLDANTSDTAIAMHLRKIRQNALPTEEELKAWPKEMSAEEKERLRVKARKLLVDRGMPMALTSVMGAVASGEALGTVFDALQVERVARGVMFGLVVQGLRGVTQ